MKQLEKAAFLLATVLASLTKVFLHNFSAGLVKNASGGESGPMHSGMMKEFEAAFRQCHGMY